MYSRDLERLVRQLVRQKCDEDYIRYYLQDTYQLDVESINQMFEKIGIGGNEQDMHAGPSAAAKKQQGRAGKFYQ